MIQSSYRYSTCCCCCIVGGRQSRAELLLRAALSSSRGAFGEAHGHTLSLGVQLVGVLRAALQCCRASMLVHESLRQQVCASARLIKEIAAGGAACAGPGPRPQGGRPQKLRIWEQARLD